MSGLSVSEILMCDRENMTLVDDLSGIDVIILTGGHVPTENVFFKELGLREKLRDFDGLVIAWSAGSMNCADTVYAGPEIPVPGIPGSEGPFSGTGFPRGSASMRHGVCVEEKNIPADGRRTGRNG